ncbi:T6SS immunity protein Tdi1 domain-containing protein [Zobellia laminariae]|uniref:T6SS immunity protein Tdi1 domain-containing protein n=1 Tax=Zobellia laminariae TaxID=248906 RepID=UPI0026F47595|nr:T6SS immunity protein Tdi1 domain-containing protein [Zobellia laminariae]WKX76205.1 DUF1851 domain-containing protein [Zobellia laminariae]
MSDKFFKKYSEYNIQILPSKELLNSYSISLPDKFLQLWKDYGSGTFLDGYLKLVNPNDFKDLLHNVYVNKYDNPLVLFATAMSDLIIWENNYLVLLDFRHGFSKVLESGFEYFMDDLTDNEFLEEDLKWNPFEEAKMRLGELDYDECYGYVPILAAGGGEKAENLQKVKIKEHLTIIAQLAGKIE